MRGRRRLARRPRRSARRAPAPQRAADAAGADRTSRPTDAAPAPTARRDPARTRRCARRLAARERGWEPRWRTPACWRGWAEIVGAEIAAHCRPERLEDGDADVSAPTPRPGRPRSGCCARHAGAARAELALGAGVAVDPLPRARHAPSWKRGPQIGSRAAVRATPTADRRRFGHRRESGRQTGESRPADAPRRHWGRDVGVRRDG